MREIRFRGLRTDGKGWVYGGGEMRWRKIEDVVIKTLYKAIAMKPLKKLPPLDDSTAGDIALVNGDYYVCEVM